MAHGHVVGARQQLVVIIQMTGFLGIDDQCADIPVLFLSLFAHGQHHIRLNDTSVTLVSI